MRLRENIRNAIGENKLLISCLILIAILITIANPNSFLYRVSDCDDAGIYYNVAKGMLQGKVLYRDIFDHKGPFIFFIYAIHNIIFPCKMYGAYIMDLICYAVIMLFSYRLFKTKFENNTSVILATVSTALLVWINNSFGCPEIFAVLLETVILYWAYTDKVNKKSYLAFFGIMVGILLMTKFTLTAFAFVMFFYFLYYNIKEKTSIKIVMQNICVLIGGMSIPILISMIYLLNNNVLNEFCNVYILINGGYASAGINIIKLICIAVVIVGSFAFGRFLTARNKIILVAFMSQLSLIIASNFFVYAALPVVVVFIVLSYNLLEADNRLIKSAFGKVLIIISVFMVLLGTVHLVKNYKKSYPVAESNDMLLFSVAAHIFTERSEAPENKYFFTPNVSVEANIDMWHELYDMVEKKVPDNIYVCYDGNYGYMRRNHIEDSGEEVMRILSKLKDNYNCVQAYSDGIYKWKRK